jgi:hypothetical protein
LTDGGYPEAFTPGTIRPGRDAIAVENVIIMQTANGNGVLPMLLNSDGKSEVKPVGAMIIKKLH